jgi:serine/threonine-protein kinase
MGEVYEASHLESGVDVAIKILRRTASEKVVERFGREGRAMAQMQSVHVIRVFDIGLLGSGRPYIAMERLFGSDLSVVVQQRGTLPMVLAVTYVLDACVGLAEAHGLGMVHRDLKPANLFRAEMQGGATVIKILDFGISKVNAAAKQGKTGLTEADDVFGSPRYMSPEQLRASRDVDARGDIWSLGVTLAELVTGRPPFDARDMGALMFAIFEDEPPSIAHVDPTHGPALDAVLKRCLAKAPEARFDSVADLAEALAPFVDGGRQRASRVREVFADAKRRHAGIERQAPPQVTRVLEPRGDRQTAALVRIDIAPVAPTMAHLPAASPPRAAMPAAPPASPPRKTGVPVGAWIAAAALGVSGLGAAAWWGTTGDTTAPSETEDEQSRNDEQDERRKRSKTPSTSEPTAAPKSRELPPAMAKAPTFTIAPDIVELLRKTHGEPFEVRDLVFFADRAVLLVTSKKGLVRYDYAEGKLSDPRPAKVRSGARRDERIGLDEVNVGLVPKMATEAQGRFGEEPLHSIGLLWLADELQWVATSKGGNSVRYRLDGSLRGP